MFSISSVAKMFGSKLDSLIEKSDNKIVLKVPDIEAWCVKEKLPYKLVINDNKEIVIVKR